MPNELYDALTRRFDKHHKLPKGGSQLDYISTEQCITRLNDVLGVDGWDFEIREHGCENSTLWALGRLTAYFPERTVAREQFGECATSRGMADGDARKGAASDCLKKCASLIGVALYLSDKHDHGGPQAAPMQRAPARPAQATPRTVDGSALGESASRALESAPAGGDYVEPGEDAWIVFDEKVRAQTGYSRGDVCALLGHDPADHLRTLNLSGTPKTGKALLADLIAYKREGRPIPGVVTQPAVIEGEVSEAVKTLQDDIKPSTSPAPEVYGCQVCGNELEETKFRDGTSWTPATLAEFGRKKHDMVLCMDHYREMNAAKAGKLGADPVMA